MSGIISALAKITLFILELILDVFCLALLLASLVGFWRWIFLPEFKESNGRAAFRWLAVTNFGAVILDILLLPLALVTLASWRCVRLCGRVSSVRSDRYYGIERRGAVIVEFGILLLDIACLVPLALGHACFWRIPFLWSELFDEFRQHGVPLLHCGERSLDTECREIILRNAAHAVLDLLVAPFALVVGITVYRVPLVRAKWQGLDTTASTKNPSERLLKKKLIICEQCAKVFLDLPFALVGVLTVLLVFRAKALWEDYPTWEHASDRRIGVAAHFLLSLRDWLCLPFAVPVFASVYRGWFCYKGIRNAVTSWADPKPLIAVQSATLELPEDTRGTGIKLHIVGQLRDRRVRLTPESSDVEVYIRNSDFWEGVSREVGMGVASLGQTMLPLSLAPKYFDVRQLEHVAEDGTVRFTVDVSTSVQCRVIRKNAKKLSSERVVLQVQYANATVAVNDSSAGRRWKGDANERPLADTALPLTVAAASTSGSQRDRPDTSSLPPPSRDGTLFALAINLAKFDDYVNRGDLVEVADLEERYSADLRQGKRFCDVCWKYILVEMGFLLFDVVVLTFLLLLHLFPHRIYRVYSSACEGSERRQARKRAEAIGALVEFLENYEGKFIGLVSIFDDEVRKQLALVEPPRSAFAGGGTTMMHDYESNGDEERSGGGLFFVPHTRWWRRRQTFEVSIDTILAELLVRIRKLKDASCMQPAADLEALRDRLSRGALQIKSRYLSHFLGEPSFCEPFDALGVTDAELEARKLREEARKTIQKAHDDANKASCCRAPRSQKASRPKAQEHHEEEVWPRRNSSMDYDALQILIAEVSSLEDMPNEAPAAATSAGSVTGPGGADVSLQPTESSAAAAAAAAGGVEVQFSAPYGTGGDGDDSNTSASASSVALPPPLPTMTVRDRVEAIYRLYNPAKLGTIDAILKHYVGQEDDLIAALVCKYGPEPPQIAPVAALHDGTREGGVGRHIDGDGDERAAALPQSAPECSEQLAAAVVPSPPPLPPPVLSLPIEGDNANETVWKISRDTDGAIAHLRETMRFHVERANDEWSKEPWCGGKQGWAGVRERVVEEVRELMYDTLAVFCVLIVVALLYRIIPLVQALRTVHNKRRACLRQVLEIGIDATYVGKFLLVLLFVRGVVSLPADLLFYLAQKPSFRVARRIIDFHLRNVLEDILYVLCLFFAWDTLRFAVATAVFGVFSPAVVLEGAFSRVDAAADSHRDVCTAGFLLLLSSAWVVGVPVFVGYYVAAHNVSPNPAIVYYAVMAFVLYLGLVVSLLQREQRITAIRRSVTRCLSSFSCRGLGVMCALVLELAQLLGLVFSISSPALFGDRLGTGLATASNYVFATFGADWTRLQLPFGTYLAVVMCILYFIVSGAPVVCGDMLHWRKGSQLVNSPFWAAAMQFLGQVCMLTVVRNIATLFPCDESTGILSFSSLSTPQRCWNGSMRSLGVFALVIFTYYVPTALMKNRKFLASLKKSVEVEWTQMYHVLTQLPIATCCVLVTLLQHTGDPTAVEVIILVTMAWCLLVSLAYETVFGSPYCSVRSIALYRLTVYAVVLIASILVLAQARRSSATPYPATPVFSLHGCAAVVFGCGTIAWIGIAMQQSRQTRELEDSIDDVKQRLVDLRHALRKAEALRGGCGDAQLVADRVWMSRVRRATRASQLAALTLALEESVFTVSLAPLFLVSRKTWREKTQRLIEPVDELGDVELDLDDMDDSWHHCCCCYGACSHASSRSDYDVDPDDCDEKALQESERLEALQEQLMTLRRAAAATGAPLVAS